MKNDSFSNGLHVKKNKLKRISSSLVSRYKFFRLCLNPKHHKTMGALCSSSRFLSAKMANIINANLTPKNILEVGAGTGPITKYILKKLQTEDTFDIVEITQEFIPELKGICKNYSQANIFNSSILKFKPNYKYDYIISALPFYSFPTEMVIDILNHYKDLLKEGGTIVYFQYILADRVNKFKDKNLSTYIYNFKKNFKVSKKVEYINILPAIVWILENK